MTVVANTPLAWSERASASSSWDAAGWSERGQTQRFLAALRHLELRPGDSLLDYGCGTGRFCEFLPADVAYHGFDWAPGMRDRARVDHERAIIHDELPNVLFDHVVAIGTFNLPGSTHAEATIAHLLANHVRRSLVVSLYRGRDERCVRYRPDAIAGFANAFRWFAIDCSYLDNDLMLVVRK